jgi:hypothetical protein
MSCGFSGPSISGSLIVPQFGEVAKGQRKTYVTADNGEEKEYSVQRGVHVNVQEGERLKAGEPLTIVGCSLNR